MALYLGSKILDKEILAQHRHSEILLPLVQELLTEAELTLSQLDGIAFGAGPGSFTGLRIACGVAQGLAYGANLPVIGISTLEAMAQRIGNQKIVVAFDARLNEIYHSAYQKAANQRWKIISPPIICSPHHAPPLLGDNWTGCGSGFDVYYRELSALYSNNIQQIYHNLHPQAKEIAQLALPRFNDGSNTDPAQAIPVYLRNKVALRECER